MMGYGYENAAGDRISALIDMINGGGPGRSGGTFEGGGILSLLANAVAKPYGSVRERPGHTPMGATAAPMEVLRPVARPVATERVSTTALSEPRSFETEAAAPRYLTEDEKSRLANLPESIAPPDLLSHLRGIPARSELSPEEGMILDALLASASFNPAVQGRRGLNFQRTSAPIVSPRPRPRPDADTDADAGTRSISGPSAPQDPLVPAPIDIPAARDTAYDSLGDPTFFTPDQLDAMSPEMRAMAEEHNRENLMLASEVFRVPAAPVVSPRPRPRPNAGPESPPPAAPSANQPVREVFSGVPFDVYPNGVRVNTLTNEASATLGKSSYHVYPDGRVFEMGYFGVLRDEVPPGTQLYYDVKELVNQVR